MDINIPALSVQQPWAELIISGRKQIEIRRWSTSYRGDCWLHTGLKRNPELEKLFSIADPFTGGFLGTVRIELIIPLDRQRWETMRERLLVPGTFLPSMFGWIFSNPKRFLKPVNGPGQLRLFYPDKDIYVKLINSTFLD